MPRRDLSDILAFLAVARERSFTRAAAQLGVSQSALSQTVRGLEARLGLRLLTRTTRSVAPTEAGGRLLPARGAGLDEDHAGVGAPRGAARGRRGGGGGRAPPAPSGSRRPRTRPSRSSGPRWSGSCRTTRTSGSRL